MWEVLLDSLLDTLKVVPILYLVYLLVCYVGHNSNNKYAKLMNKTKRYGPMIGGAVGCIPQCGFSIVMSDLYSKKAVTIGTLIAVMLATSDEAIPLMLSNPDHIVEMLILIAIKIVIAVVFGYLFDLIFLIVGKKQEIDTQVFEKTHNHDCELTSCSHKHIIHNHTHSKEHEHHKEEHIDKSESLEKHRRGDCVDNIFLDALLHTLQITIFLFVVTFVIGLIVEKAGMENLTNIFTNNKFVQPFIAALIGLFPSCASSVFLVEFYMAGGITFGAMLAGLCAGSGIGLVVLFTKNKKHIWTNIIILASLYLIGSIVGVICALFV